MFHFPLPFHAVLAGLGSLFLFSGYEKREGLFLVPFSCGGLYRGIDKGEMDRLGPAAPYTDIMLSMLALCNIGKHIFFCLFHISCFPCPARGYIFQRFRAFQVGPEKFFSKKVKKGVDTGRTDMLFYARRKGRTYPDKNKGGLNNERLQGV